MLLIRQSGYSVSPVSCVDDNIRLLCSFVYGKSLI